MTNLDNILESRGIALLTKMHIVKAVVMILKNINAHALVCDF